jgi:hypothetical protein
VGFERDEVVMGNGVKAVVVGAGVVGLAAVVRQRGHDVGGGVVAVTVLRPLEEVAGAWDGPPAVGDVELIAAPVDRGTEVRVRVSDSSGVAERVRGESPRQQVRDRLRRLKATLEAGEVVTTEGQSSGRGPVGEAVTVAVSRRSRAWGVS